MNTEFSYDNSKVYGDARRLLYNMVKIVSHYPKNFKYTVGQRLIEHCINLASCIALAYREQKPDIKLNKIERAVSLLDLIIVSFRLSYDMHFVSRNDNSEQLSILMSIYKQLEGWSQSQAKKVSS